MVAGRLIARVLVAAAACGAAHAQSERRIAGLNPEAEAQEGKAVVYASDLAKAPTASGVPYDPRARTAAHANLPFGARLRVTRIDDGRAVTVMVNDRMRPGGPYILVLSPAAAARIGLNRPGVVTVRTELIGMTPIKPRPDAQRARP